MKQTAVDWLFQQLDEQVYRIDRLENRINISISFEDMQTIKSNSKQMEKEQIKDAYDSGQVLGFYLGSINEDETDQTGEIFYQEKYK
jgi:hypothetical protein